MNFHVITLMPEMIEQSLKFGVIGKSFEKSINELHLINPRQFTTDRHQSVDDRPFGGGDGMLMMAEPLQKSLESLPSCENIFYLSPQGAPWTDQMARDLATQNEMTLICGRYGGVDQRFLNHNSITEISIGDYVLSGGELAALVIIDSVCRHIPEVLGHDSSASDDSFKDGLLEAPHFTRPQLWQDQQVPQTLLSGDHKKILHYKTLLSYLVTLVKRPDLLKSKNWPVDDVKKQISSWPQEDWQALGLDQKQVMARLSEVESE